MNNEILTIAKAEPQNNYEIRLVFSDGQQGVVDCEDFLWGEVFAPLKDVDFFQKVKVSDELGTVYWPNGADIAPEALREKVQYYS